MNRLVIVEGPDNCGKSTLAKSIAMVYDAVYWRLTSGPGLSEHAAMELYQRNALDNAEVNIDQGHCVVLDRHWPSDFVYGQVLRGRPSCAIPEMLLRCKEMRVMYIYCMRANAVMEHAKDKDPDHPYDDAVYSEVVDRYATLFHSLDLRGEVIVDYFLDDYIGQPEKMQQFISELALKGYAL